MPEFCYVISDYHRESPLYFLAIKIDIKIYYYVQLKEHMDRQPIKRRSKYEVYKVLEAGTKDFFGRYTSLQDAAFEMSIAWTTCQKIFNGIPTAYGHQWEINRLYQMRPRPSSGPSRKKGPPKHTNLKYKLWKIRRME